MKEKKSSKMRLGLNELKVHSFVTSIREDEKREVKAGDAIPDLIYEGDTLTTNTFTVSASWPVNCTESHGSWCTAIGSACVDPVTTHCD